MHWHSGNRTWRQCAAHSDPGHRITAPPHLRRRTRGCENTCYHATKENKFSPVHSVIGFQRLKPPRFESCGTGKDKGNDRITNAPPLPATAAISKAAEHLPLFEIARVLVCGWAARHVLSRRREAFCNGERTSCRLQSQREDFLVFGRVIPRMERRH